MYLINADAKTLFLK